MLKKTIKPLLVLVIIGPFVYLEIVTIPGLLAKHFASWGQVGDYAVVMHFASILVIAGATGVLGLKTGRNGVMETHRLLVDSSLSPLVNTIEKVVNGKWSTDASIQGQALNVGAKVGMVAGQAKAGQVDPDQVVAAIESLSVPQAKGQSGAGVDVISEMNDYMLEQKKERLS